MNYGLPYALQYVLHLLEDLVCGQHLGRRPKEGYVESALKRQKQFFLQPISLAQLSFDSVALHRTFEVALGDRHHDADTFLLAWHEDGTNRES